MEDLRTKNQSTEKVKALAAALSQIEKQFGKGSIMRFGENEVVDDIQSVSTGSLGLDIALGIGGLPRGRVVEIYGPESSFRPCRECGQGKIFRTDFKENQRNQS